MRTNDLQHTFVDILAVIDLIMFVTARHLSGSKSATIMTIRAFNLLNTGKIFEERI